MMLTFPLGILEWFWECCGDHAMKLGGHGDLLMLQSVISCRSQKLLCFFCVFYESPSNFRMLKMPSLQILTQSLQTRHTQVLFSQNTFLKSIQHLQIVKFHLKIHSFGFSETEDLTTLDPQQQLASGQQLSHIEGAPVLQFGHLYHSHQGGHIT